VAVTSKSFTKAEDDPKKADEKTTAKAELAETTSVKTDKADDDEPKLTAAEEREAKAGECVVDEDFHVGRAVPGTKVCSYHTMHYNNDGSKRV
jgi:hypothetical protein